MDKEQKAWKVPHTFIIVFFVVLAAAILTYVVPKGQFETEELTYMKDGEEQTKTVLNPDSFRYLKDDEGNLIREGTSLFEPGGGIGFLNYVFEGLVSGDKWGSAVGVVAFILIIGGAFGIIMKTRAIEEGILKVIERTKGKESLIIPIMFFLFSLGGAVFGMGEEAIAFAMILVPIMIAIGYDAHYRNHDHVRRYSNRFCNILDESFWGSDCTRGIRRSGTFRGRFPDRDVGCVHISGYYIYMEVCKVYQERPKEKSILFFG